ncbi:MAG: GNAT family N-acetyltransferase, partial [Acidimicrobiales bacterium]
PESLLAAAAHDAAFAGGVRLLVVDDGDRFKAALAVRQARRWRRLPVPALTTRLDPDPVPLFPVLGTPLVAADEPAAACTGLLRALSDGAVFGAGRRPALVTVDRLHLEGPVGVAWTEASQSLGLPFELSDPYDRPILLRAAARESGLAWPEVLGAKRLREARRRAQRLEAKLGGAPRCVDRTGDPAAVDELIAMEAGGWKGEAGTALRCHPHLEAAFRDLCRRWAETGGLSLLTLEAGGVPVATQCAVRSGDGMFVFRITYDETFSRFGPGVLLGLASGEHFEGETDARFVDSCSSPSNPFYQDFFPERLALRTVTTALRPSGRALLAASPHLQASARAARVWRERAEAHWRPAVGRPAG